MSYPEFNEEEPVSRSLLKEVFESSVLLWELVCYVQDVHRLQVSDITGERAGSGGGKGLKMKPLSNSPSGSREGVRG